MTGAIAWYDANAETVSERYEGIAAERVHGWLLDLLPPAPALVLDVGAGSGRDAAWLSGRGYDVVAAEPSAQMRNGAQARHADKGIRWIADGLPDLALVFKSGLSFDLILVSAVWMHVAPASRARAFRKLVTLLNPGGVIALTLRDGPADAVRGCHPVSSAEIESLARQHGAYVERSNSAADQLGRDDVRWTLMAVRLPDDGAGALPLLRHVVLNDDKSSTYKLGLLRALCRIADGAAGLARDHGDDHVAIPMSLVALTWIRLYKPLLAAALPQSPRNRGYENLGFAKAAFRSLDAFSAQDLRVGLRCAGDAAASLHEALRDAASTIARMPASYITYPGGNPVFPVRRTGRLFCPTDVLLDGPYLDVFGEMLVPAHLWRALQRFSCWIEPALIAEWIRLMKFYAERQGRALEEASLAAAMTWAEPTRDARIAREQALRLFQAGHLHCVWSGKRLSLATIDIDHCFPWAAWPCGDLWNLLPAHRMVNQRQKRHQLPSESALRACEERITTWWDAAYRRNVPGVIFQRFAVEAAASLPGMGSSSLDLDDLFSAVSLQRMRLKHDQQVPEWDGPTTR